MSHPAQIGREEDVAADHEATADASSARPPQSASSRRLVWIPVGLALAYPWSLVGFHRAVGSTSTASASIIWLLAAFLLPLSNILIAWRSEKWSDRDQTAMRRMAFAALAAPPLFVSTGVLSGLLNSPLPDLWLWSLGWLTVGIAASLGSVRPRPQLPFTAPRRLRFVHGAAGAVILLFIAFHLTNHLLGLFGPGVHARMMTMGRAVYRSETVEPMLVALLLFQVIGGIKMAWRWSNRSLAFADAIQVGSGAYLAAFILTHLNSALVSARWDHGIQTDWAWATGAPDGLLVDAWNIRLLPHYTLGVFFLITHLFCGLRTIFLAHGVRQELADRTLALGLTCGGGVSLLIAAALCGLRF